MKKLLILLFFAYHYLCSAQLPELVLPQGHSQGILNASYSANGKFILTASMDNTARIWDTYSGKLISVLNGHSGYVNKIESTNDSKLAITASNDNTVKIWTIPEGILKYNFACEYCFYGVFECSSDSKLLAIASGIGKVKIYSLQTGLLIKELQCHRKKVRKIRFSNDSKTILTAAKDEKIIKATNIDKEIVLFEINYLEWEPDFEFVDSGREILIKEKKNMFYNSVNGVFLRSEIKKDNSDETVEIYSPDKRTYLFIGAPDGNFFLNYASIHNAKTGLETRRFASVITNISSIQLSPDKKLLASLLDDKSTRIWDITSGKPLPTLHEDSLSRPELWNGASVFTNDGTKLITVFYDSCSAIIWNIGTQKSVDHLEGVKYDFPRNYDLNFTNCSFNNNETLLLISNWGCISVFDAKSFKMLFQKSEPHISSANWTDNGKKIVIKYIGLEPEIINVENWALLHRFNFEMNDSDGYIENFKVGKGGKYGISLSTSKKIGLWDISKWQLLHVSPDYKSFNFIDYDENHNYIITSDTGNLIQLVNPESGKVIQTFNGHNGSVSFIDFNVDGTQMVSFSDKVKEVICWNISSGKKINTVSPSEKPYSYFTFEDKYFAHSDLEVLCYEKKKNDIKFRMAAIGENGYICLLKNGKYRCSKEALKYLSWKKDNKLYGFDQWDLIYNRPDEVLKMLESSDTALISAFYKTYLKRVKKMNADSSSFINNYPAPEIFILNADSLQGIAPDSMIFLKVKAVDKSSKGNIKKISVTVNNSNLPEFDVLYSFEKPKDEIILRIPVVLSYGENNIEVSCLNNHGNSSLKNRIIIDYMPDKTPISKTYVFCISVAEYKNSNYNLKYSVKDGHDISALFAGRNACIDTLFNQNAIYGNIMALKQKLMKTNVNDEVIIYVSGHGLLGKNYDFYYATYDMNFENPEEKGVLYDDLEGLLDGIPARKKLLLIDACHSGEIDKENIEVKESVVNLEEGKTGKIKTYNPRGLKIISTNKNGLGLYNSFELMQELFANISLGSGVVVISAAAGTEFALESSEWKNGVFTFCIINALKNMAADKNRDKKVSISELKNYVGNEVERLTKGAQKPTSRRESMEYDWFIW